MVATVDGFVLHPMAESAAKSAEEAFDVVLHVLHFSDDDKARVSAARLILEMAGFV